MFDTELESFKRDIDLRAYAAGQGYVLAPKESWRGSAVMRNSSGDKIIIKRDQNGHYLYFSVHDDRDNGTIVDFVQVREKCSLGVVRKLLRPWLGRPPVPVPELPALHATTGKDRLRVETEYARTREALRHPYLENDRAVPPDLLGSERFAGRVRVDARGNAVFPHFDQEGLCGYEIKNLGFTGFSSGGAKALWLSHEREDDNRLVICESAIDALSHAVLFLDNRARYASIGGKPNPQQSELIRSAIARTPAGSEIVAAMDADTGGAKLAGIVRQAFELAGRDDLRFTAQEPFGFKDWNDQLRAKPRRSLTCRFEEPSVA